MKRKDLLKDLRGMTKENLVVKARGLAEELMKLRFKKASGQLSTSHQLRQVRVDLARVQTVLKASSKAAAK